MPVRIALTGFVALIVAMGIGRFSLTPQLPLMLEDGQIDVTGAGLVAAANYLGYLAGAFDAMRARRATLLRLHGGLWLVVACTLLSALAGALWSHAVLRFITGVASAWVMIMTAAWTQDALAHSGRPTLAAGVFAGPGAGILLVGLIAIILNQALGHAAAGWLVYGLTAAAVALILRGQLPRQLPEKSAAQHPLPLSPALWRLALGYGLAGFGYILPATFLSHLAWEAFPGSLLADLFWPLFGAAAMCGVWLGARSQGLGATRSRLAVTLWLQAGGVFACLALPGLAGLLLGAMFAGGTFLTVVQLALQGGRELAPDHGRAVAGLLTTTYAIGQFAGPLAAAWSSYAFHNLNPALAVASVALVIAGVLVLPSWDRQRASI